MGALGDVPELLPACGRLGVQGRRVGEAARVLGELGAGGAEGVLVQREERLEALSKLRRELWVAGGGRRAQHGRELPGVVGRLTRAGSLLQLGEQPTGLLVLGGGEARLGGGRERDHD